LERCVNETKLELGSSFSQFSFNHLTSPLFSSKTSELCENEENVKDAIIKVGSDDAVCTSSFSLFNGGIHSYISNACDSQNCTDLAMVEWEQNIATLNDDEQSDAAKLASLCIDPETTKGGFNALPDTCDKYTPFMKQHFQKACDAICRALVPNAWASAGTALNQEGEWFDYPTPEEPWTSVQDRRQAGVCKQRSLVPNVFTNLQCYGAQLLAEELESNCWFVDCQRWLVDEWTSLGVAELESAYTRFSTSQEQAICAAPNDAMEVGYGAVAKAHPNCDAYIRLVQTVFSDTCVVKEPEKPEVTCEECLATAESLYSSSSGDAAVDCALVATVADGISACIGRCREEKDGEQSVRNAVDRAKDALGRDGKCELNELDDVAARLARPEFSETTIIIISVVGVVMCSLTLLAYRKWDARVQARRDRDGGRTQSDMSGADSEESYGEAYNEYDQKGVAGVFNPHFDKDSL
jgi:hypothetical protein